MAPPVGEGEVLAGKYRVERVLGEGAHGVVVAARHLELDEPVAIKFLRKDSARDPALVERFLREARTAVRLKNEHAVRVFDVGKLETGGPYIVMEYLAGHDLERVLAMRGPLPVEDAVGYVVQACEAVAEAHALGMVHRDLKLSNLFLAERPDEPPLVKVLDFGIAKWKTEDPGAKRLTTDKIGMGSPLYMAPEQIADAAEADGRADVWSLGVILQELLTGKSPFDAPTVERVLASVLTREPARLRDVVPSAPPALESAVVACLQKAPSSRTASVVDLALALEPFASEEDKRSIARIVRTRGARSLRTSVPEFASSELVRAAAVADTAKVPDPARATQHTAAITKDEDIDDPTAMGLPAPRSWWRWVATGLVAASVAAVAVFATRGSSTTTDRASASALPSAAPVPSGVPAPSPSAAVAPPAMSGDPSTEATLAVPPRAVGVGHPAASARGAPSTSAVAKTKTATPNAAATTSSKPPSAAAPTKPAAESNDVRHLIDGRR